LALRNPALTPRCGRPAGPVAKLAGQNAAVVGQRDRTAPGEPSSLGGTEGKENRRARPTVPKTNRKLTRLAVVWSGPLSTALPRHSPPSRRQTHEGYPSGQSLWSSIRVHPLPTFQHACLRLRTVTPATIKLIDRSPFAPAKADDRCDHDGVAPALGRGDSIICAWHDVV